MIWLLLLLIPVILFLGFLLARLVLIWTLDNDDEWWSFPTYMVGELLVASIIVFPIGLILYFVFSHTIK